MKHALLIAFVCIASLQQVFAQGWQWQRDLLTNSADNFNAIACDNDGNVFAAVQFNNLLQIESYSFQTNPIEDVCVVKYDSLGNVIWAEAFGGLYSDQINAMACDSAGNVFVVGHFTAELFYFNTSIVGSTGRDIFIMRINADGTFGWIQTASNIWDEEATDVVVTQQGDIVVSGAANNTSLIAGMELISDLPNVFMQEFIAKFSNDGTPLWIRSAGATDYTSTAYSQSCLALGPDGSIHLAIPRSGGLNFAGQEVTGPAFNNTVILKWDSEGNPQWGWVGLSDGNDFLKDIAVDNQGRVYSVISTTMSSSFGGQPYTIVPGDWGMVFIRLLPDGTEDRFWLAKGIRKSDVYAVFHAPDNRIWFGGMQRHITYFSFGALNAGTVDDRDGFICAFNPSTDVFEEVNRVSGDGWQSVLGGCVNSAGQLYFGGDMSGAIGTPVYFGIQNEITNNMYIDGKTLPFIARYGSLGCLSETEVLNVETVAFCSGESIELIPDVPLYGWQWSDGTFSSLQIYAEGSYGIQAITLQGCIESDTVLSAVEIAPQLNWVIQPVNCSGASDGSMSVEADGSNPPYIFSWNGVPVDAQFGNVAAGTYQLLATSFGGCSTAAQIEMTEPDPLAIEYTTFYDELTAQGTIAVTAVSGGTPPYSVFWPAQPQAEDSISGMPMGTYLVQITDAAGCVQEFELLLTTGIQTVDALQLSCFPQPASEFVTMQCSEQFKWTLLDAMGNELQGSGYFRAQHRIELAGYSAGVYFLSATTPSGRVQTIPLVKQ